MKPIQLILFLLLSASVLVYFARFRSRIFDRLVILMIGIVGFTFIARPDWSTIVAQWFGVGRGADLITYLGLLALTFLLLLAYAEIRALDTKIADLVRTLAIERAHYPTEQKNVEAAS
jgi:hypothetical protein